MTDRAMRRDMARDLHYVGVPGDLDVIADFLISRRGWTKQARAERTDTVLQPVLAPMIRDDAADAVHIAITGFTADGAPMLGNTARTAAQRIAEAHIRQDRRRATDG